MHAPAQVSQDVFNGDEGVPAHHPALPPAPQARAQRMIASALRSTSTSVVAHELTLIRMAHRPCHPVIPHQHVPSC